MKDICKILLFLSIIIVAFSFFYLSNHTSNFDGIITIDDYKSEVTNYSTFFNGELDSDYLYMVMFTLKDVPSSAYYDDLIVYFYNDSGVVLDNKITYKSNNTTFEINSDNYDEYNESISEIAFLHSNKFINITHVEIVIVDDGKVLFNITKAFNMSNCKNQNISISNNESNSTSTLEINDSSKERFDELDINHDKKLTISEFEELGEYIMEDSFWKGYSIEEAVISEFENLDGNGDGYLTLDEFSKIY